MKKILRKKIDFRFDTTSNYKMATIEMECKNCDDIGSVDGSPDGKLCPDCYDAKMVANGWENGIIPNCEKCGNKFAEDGHNYNERDGDEICDDCDEEEDEECEKCDTKVPTIGTQATFNLWVECSCSAHPGWYCPDHSPGNDCFDDEECDCCNPLEQGDGGPVTPPL